MSIKRKETLVKNLLEKERKVRSGPPRTVSVPDVPAADAGPQSATPPDTGHKAKRREWRSRLLGHVKKKVPEGKPQKLDVSLKTAKKQWWHRLFGRRRSRRQCNWASEGNSKQRDSAKPQPCSVKKDEGKLFTYRHEPLLDKHHQMSTNSANLTTFTGLGDFCRGEPRKECVAFAPVRWNVHRFGFPNTGQSCYMNSSLQSLLALTDFIQDVKHMEHIWSSVPEAQVIRRLMAIRDTRTCTEPLTKRHLLRSFKRVVSLHAPEFNSNLQQDAHEFLISVLAQMRSLSPILCVAAAQIGASYICPVTRHLVFKMCTTRTCRRCWAESTTEEEFTNLSLNLVPGACVEVLLQSHLMERELEFRCECGGTTSVQRLSIRTLPRVLVLHLVRFRHTPFLGLEKIQDPVKLPRDMFVSSNQGGACFSLVSAISHIGILEAGHYICDAIHPEAGPHDPGDRWLTFNDLHVFETTGRDVCEQRQELAYILFYRRMV